VLTTHQVEEIQDVLTDLMFIDAGRIVLQCGMDDFESRFAEVMVRPADADAARALGPVHERELFGRAILLYDGADRRRLAALGEVRTPGISDVFTAMMSKSAGAAPGAAR